MKIYLAIPAEGLGIKGNTAKVGFGEGVLRDVNVMFVDAKVNSTFQFTLDMLFR